jgi:hypothetical protein
MSQYRITNLLAFFGWEPLSFVEDDKTPGHFLQPLVCFSDFAGFWIELAFQIGISGNENMAFFVPDIIRIVVHGLCSKNDNIVPVYSLGPLFNLSFPLIAA